MESLAVSMSAAVPTVLLPTDLLSTDLLPTDLLRTYRPPNTAPHRTDRPVTTYRTVEDFHDRRTSLDYSGRSVGDANPDSDD